jgi:hypothetical protein
MPPSRRFTAGSRTGTALLPTVHEQVRMMKASGRPAQQMLAEYEPKLVELGINYNTFLASQDLRRCPVRADPGLGAP